MAVAVTVTGIISTFSPGATGICQWGASGALACIPGSSRVDIFDGESASNHFGAYRFGMTSPTRITSIGSRAVFAVDDVGLVSKIDSNWNFQWSIQAPAGWTNVDIKAAPSSTDLGGVIYLSSATGVASYRDMLGEGWKYGECDVAADLGRYPSVFPVISVVPSLSNVRILAKTEAVTTPKGYTNSSWRESSSSSSVSSQSSDSSSSLSSISSSSSSPSNSVSSSSSPTGHFTYIPLGPFTVEITAYDPTGRPFMTIPDTIGSKNVATIGPQAFRNSTITGATMGSHVTSMLQRAFEGCINLTTVSISSGLTSISSMAFYGCTSLTSIYFQGNAPTVSSDSFTNVPSGCIVYYHPSATGFTNPWHGFTTATYP